MGPLEGVRILDLSMVVSGPFSAMMLGDLGADVIKIEPPEGDVIRNIPGPTPGDVPIGIINSNRNKRAMVLDLKQPGANEVFLRMAANADVVVQNVRPGVVDRLCVGYEAVAARNPKIVYRLWFGLFITLVVRCPTGRVVILVV
jgi:crotonobetainyl-CoA:carnitine CoA-transferase CaiB-like acyl-CoA transferase